eukprot:UN03359
MRSKTYDVNRMINRFRCVATLGRKKMIFVHIIEYLGIYSNLNGSIVVNKGSQLVFSGTLRYSCVITKCTVGNILLYLIYMVVAVN